MQTLGWMDSAKVSTYLLDEEGQSHKKHLGMINLFQTTHEVEIPFMKDLFAESAVLECAEDESITYDLPVSRTEVKCYSAVINNKEKGAAINALRSHYGASVIEIVSPTCLRSRLKLKDGHKVKVDILILP